MAWAPDGQSLVVELKKYSLGAAGDGVHRLLRIEDDGSHSTIIHDDPGPELSPAYSPDGRLAYHHGWSDDPTSGVWIDGFPAIPFPPLYQTRFSWSPDGTSIVLLMADWPASPLGLHRVNVGNGSYTLLMEQRLGEPIRDPAYSPSGSRIAFTKFEGSVGGRIWTIAADGTDPRRLTSCQGDGSPTWSPDGSRIAYTRNSREIVAMDIDGGNIVRLVLAPSDGTIFTVAWR